MSMFGTRANHPPPGILPQRLEECILPRPQNLALNDTVVPLTRAGGAAADVLCSPNAEDLERAAVTWLRSTLRREHGWESADSTPDPSQIHIVIGVVKPGSIAQVWADQLGIHPPEAEESYALHIGDRGVALLAATARGLLRGVSTLVQLVRRNPDGELCIACGEIVDWPAMPVRMLHGWGLYRGWRMREIIEFAFRYKYNRIVYNWWNWTAPEHLTAEDRWLVKYARTLGMELQLELRRLSFGDTFDGFNKDHIGRILAVYDEAIDAGFRTFGILYDDQSYQTVDAEIHLVLTLYRHLKERIGPAAELFFSQRVYWIPGEQAGWPPHPERAEEHRHTDLEYLLKVGAALPPDIQFYIANNWNDYPEGYARLQEEGFNTPARRTPFFFDNQVANDPRRSVIVPFPVHHRPPEIASVNAGYGPNTPVPLSAHYPMLVTCAALAWNPAGYDAASTWGAALHQCFGSERTALVLAALNDLNDLYREWTTWDQPDEQNYTTEWRQFFKVLNNLCHYWTLNNKLKNGLLTSDLIRTYRQRLDALKAIFAAALARPGDGDEALHHYRDEMERLDLDMAVIGDILETLAHLNRLPPAERVAAVRAYGARQQGRLHRILAIQARRLPPAQDIQMLLLQPDGTYLFPEYKAEQMSGWWWVNFFYHPLKCDLEAILKSGDELLAPLAANAQR